MFGGGLKRLFCSLLNQSSPVRAYTRHLAAKSLFLWRRDPILFVQRFSVSLSFLSIVILVFLYFPLPGGFLFLLLLSDADDPATSFSRPTQPTIANARQFMASICAAAIGGR